MRVFECLYCGCKTVPESTNACPKCKVINIPPFIENGYLVLPEKFEVNTKEVEIVVRLNNIFDFANKFLCSNPAVKCDACCSGCAANNGYFQYKPASNTKVLEHEDISKLDIVKKCSELLKFPEALAQLEELKEDYEFNPNMGFLKDVGGCALPRNLRSVYCQITMCSFMKGAYCQEEILEIESLLRDLERIRIAEGRIF